MQHCRSWGCPLFRTASKACMHCKRTSQISIVTLHLHSEARCSVICAAVNVEESPSLTCHHQHRHHPALQSVQPTPAALQSVSLEMTTAVQPMMGCSSHAV